LEIWAKVAGEQPDNIGGSINADSMLRRRFIPENRTAAEMGFDVDPVRRNQIDQLLVTAKLSTGVAHGHGLSSIPAMMSRIKREILASSVALP